MSKLQDHIRENNEQYKHFSLRIEQFADFLQSAINPTVKFENGETKEMFMSEAVVIIHDDLKMVKTALSDLNARTEILDDFVQIKKNWAELKRRIMKILRPIFRFVVYVSTFFILIYLVVMVITGKLTANDAIDFFIKLFT